MLCCDGAPRRRNIDNSATLTDNASSWYELLKHAISVWTPAFAPCFRIIREEGKYKRLRNADKFQARVSKIRKALAETSTRPVTFHEEVCLGGDE